MMAARLSTLRIAALFFLCIALVAYELAVMRIFAVGSWSNFGSMVISIALLGYGLAGTIITLLEKRIMARPDRWLAVSASLVGPSMVLAHVLAQRVPFNPVMMLIDSRQYLWIAAYYALYALPFFVGALFIGSAFIAFRSRIHGLYFWNMVGSGLGGFLILGLLFLLPPGRLLGPIVVLSAAASFLTYIGYSSKEGRLALSFWKLAAAALLLGMSLFALEWKGQIRVSEFKPISYARDFPDASRVYHSFGPTGELNVYRSSYFHIAPGLSDNASSALATMPTDAFLGLYVDGDGPIGVMRRLEPKEAGYFDYLPMSAPYLLLHEPKVLLLRLGGGIGAYEALRHGASKVTVVEPDPALIGMLRDDPFLLSYTGRLLRDPRIVTVNTEPRAFAASSDEKFDLAEIGLVDSIGLSQTGGYAVTENFLYTVEGIKAYLSRLADSGILSVTVWNRLALPRNVPKLLATVVEALAGEGVAGPGRRIFVFDQLLSTATVLVCNRPFSDLEIAELRAFCARMSFTVCYYPGMAAPEASLDEVLKGYSESVTGGAGDSGELRQEDLYYHTVSALLRGQSSQLYKGYPFYIEPATDDRPYYTAYVKPSTFTSIVQNIRDLSEEWGYVLLVATFGFSLVFGLLIVLVPLLGRRKELFAGHRGSFSVIVYFACLGLGYMMIEMFLIQRLTFFLVDPIYSNAVVITVMLVLSGLGSLWSGGLRLPSRGVIGIAAAGICAACGFYVFGLSPIVTALLGLSLIAKIGLAVLMIAPAAFFLGVPFPTGLSALAVTRPGLVPWAWGINGALSVTGTLLARLLSVSFGYTVVLACAAGLYLLALAFAPSRSSQSS